MSHNPEKKQVQKDTTPAPNAYNIYPKNVPRNFTFGTRYKDPKEVSTTPGPGAYTAQSAFSSNNKGFSMRSRTYIKKTSENPPPGAYDPKEIKPHRSNYVFGYRIEIKSTSSNPGPGAYVYEKKFGQDAANFSFGARTNANSIYQLPGKDAPGPGSYEVVRKPEPRCTYIGEKFERLGPENLPEVDQIIQEK